MTSINAIASRPTPLAFGARQPRPSRTPAIGVEPVTVLKFGSSVLATEADAARAVHEIYRYYRSGHGVVAVVSALSGATESLLAQAERWEGGTSPRGAAALVATGEAAAAALLVLALDRAGLPAALLDPRQARLRTRGTLLDALPSGIDLRLVRRWIDRHRVVVVPGFYGVGDDDAIALLGRGGSDLTALFLAHQLAAVECRLLKDVDGVYASDPALAPRARRFRRLTWEAAAQVGGCIVQAKALAFAAKHRQTFQVAALGSGHATEIGRGPVDLEPGAPAGLSRRPLRVALLGLGTVGGGVFRLLQAERETFSVVGVAVRDLSRPRPGVPSALLGDARAVLARPCDLVVDTLSATEASADLVEASLTAGRDVVTASKAMLAVAGPRLSRLAELHGASLRFAAAVGGAVPVLEAVAREARNHRILAIRGILNGTCNFVLDEMAAGRDLRAAVLLAQERGFAEADPSRDLDGRDATCKLRILARAAFGTELAEEEIVRRGLLSFDARSLAPFPGRVIRLVASCRTDGGRLQAEVRPVALAPGHFLAGARGAENRVILERQGLPPLRLRGRGAGRWPTSEAVLADLFDIARYRATHPCCAAPHDEAKP